MKIEITKQELLDELLGRVEANADTVEEAEQMTDVFNTLVSFMYDKVEFYDEEAGAVVIEKEDALGLLGNLFVDLLQ